METLTYPFGETPREVIRKRSHDYRFLNISEFKRVKGTTPAAEVLARVPTDDLLTVLDALADRAVLVAGRNPDAPRDSLTRTCAAMVQSGKLRISILAALGIDEGGGA